ncbi:MAG: aminoacyl--tRNA ligase-related protein, partial [Acidimicrobiales bacterium]
KVELYAFCTEDQAAEVHADILERAENAIRDLGLAHRVLDLCTSDLGGASARTFDIEVYAPGADRWLEVSSISWCRDYQARRANIRYRPADAKGTRMVHTLNGSGLAVPRVWAGIVETYRRADGSVAVPDVLVPYMGGITEMPAQG